MNDSSLAIVKAGEEVVPRSNFTSGMLIKKKGKKKMNDFCESI